MRKVSDNETRSGETSEAAAAELRRAQSSSSEKETDSGKSEQGNFSRSVMEFRRGAAVGAENEIESSPPLRLRKCVREWRTDRPEVNNIF